MHLKTSDRGSPRGDHQKTIIVARVWRVKCATVTRIARGIIIAHNSRYLLVRHQDHN